MRRSAGLGLVAALVALALTGCGGDDGEGRPELTVAAAASLKTAFTSYGRELAVAQPRFSFAGSDELAAQIEQGVTPDVYAAANTTLPERLYRDGLVERPTVFAANELVLAVPEDGTVASPADLARPGVALAIGDPAVPVGDYTRRVLDRLPAGMRDAILANVRSEEPDVSGITGKLTQGAVDAGFLYRSDVRAAGGRLRAIELPDDIRPAIAYAAAVVKGADEPEAARRFIAGLLRGRGAQALRHAGFDPPPEP